MAYGLIPEPATATYQKTIFLTEPGVQPFLLVVIDGAGQKREFHFHHIF